MPKSSGPVVQLFLYNATATQAGTIYEKSCITGPEDLGFRQEEIVFDANALPLNSIS